MTEASSPTKLGEAVERARKRAAEILSHAAKFPDYHQVYARLAASTLMRSSDQGSVGSSPEAVE